MDKKLTFFLRNDGQTDGHSGAGGMILRTVKCKKKSCPEGFLTDTSHS